MKRDKSNREAYKARSVVMFPVHNMRYPRNSRLRGYLEENNYNVTTIHRGTETHSTLKGKVVGVARLFLESRKSDVVILSEMSLKFAFLTWIASRMNGCVHVVDGFIGLYETEVEDKKKYAPRSAVARILRRLDDVAVASSDIYLTDTDIRARALQQKSGKVVLSLPVGAPRWASPVALESRRERENGSPLRVLYYGNYIPLHGLDAFVNAWAEMPDPAAIQMVLIGNGDCYQDVYRQVQEKGLLPFATFVEPVDEHDLKEHIIDSDVVLGIFGDSRKARTVIANKVWQGLACGRHVLTRRSQALGEIRELVPNSLIEVDLGSDLTAMLTDLCANGAPAIDLDPDLVLELYVQARYEQFETVLQHQVALKNEALLNAKN